MLDGFRQYSLGKSEVLSLAKLPKCEVREITWKSLPEGWFLTNPSICRHNGGYAITAKAINYNAEEILSQPLPRRWESPNGDRIRIINYLFQCNNELKIEHVMPIDETWSRLDPRIAGFTEDYRCLRIGPHIFVTGSGMNNCFYHDGQIWYTKGRKYCTFLARITSTGSLKIVKVFPSISGSLIDKNWIPILRQEPEPRLDLIVNPATMARLQMRYKSPDSISRIKRSHPFLRSPYVWTGPWSGSSGGLKIGGHWAFVLHQRIEDETIWYLHKLILTNDDYKIVAESDAFVFESKGIEFCCGISRNHDGDLICISYGSRDKFSRILVIPADDFLALTAPV